MLKLQTPLTLNTLEDHMVKVHAGSFMMGGEMFDWEKPIHSVTLTHDFMLCKYPVTQALWEEVMKSNPSYFKGSQRPVEQVSWYEAVEFCNRLSEASTDPEITPCYEIKEEEVTWLKDSKGYRLPTEAEWEYAARGGSKGQGYEYAGSPDLNMVGWYNQNSQDETQAVGQKRPNELGLYDLSGNVFEWCWDWDNNYPSEAQTDPTGPEGGSHRVYRGGGWYDDAGYCRVANRVNFDIPDERYSDIGFRLARSI